MSYCLLYDMYKTYSHSFKRVQNKVLNLKKVELEVRNKIDF